MDVAELRRALLDQLHAWSLAGIETVPTGTADRIVLDLGGPAAAEDSSSAQRDAPPPASAGVADRNPPVAAPTSSPPEEIPEPVDPQSPYGGALNADERRAVFRILSAEVSECRRCPELVASRSRTVFGVGNLQPRLVFLGEAPGADEDRVGEPFVGAAGQLLNKIIVAARLQREEVYILNAIKCRPRNNRTPLDGEIATCRGFLERQLEVLQPEYIVCLGGVAARALLQEKRPVGQLRQQFYPYRSSRVLVTYHPSYLLREPSAKRLVWEDMQLLMREMGL